MSSDGVVRVFTASKNRRADEKTLLNFTEECSNQYPMKVTMGRRRFSRYISIIVHNNLCSCSLVAVLLCKHFQSSRT